MNAGPAAVLATAEEYAGRIAPEWRRSVEGILETGALLLEAKRRLPLGEFGRLFAGAEQAVAAPLPFKARSGQVLMRVASHEVLADPQYIAHLPPSWGTLGHLAGIPGPALRDLIAEGRVTADLEQIQAKNLAANWAGRPQPEEPAESLAPVATAGEYGCIVVDPPWQYGNTSTRGAAEDHYPTMSIAELEGLFDLLAEDGKRPAERSHLYLWVTNGFLAEGLHLMKAWGYEYKTALTWCKPQIGMGNYFRNSTEHVLFGIRGGLRTLRNDVPTHFTANRSRHSAKPDCFYDIAETSSPGPYLDTFARTRSRFGWDGWGHAS